VLSTRIEETAERGISRSLEGRTCFGGGRMPVWWFYGSVFFGLLTGLVASVIGMLAK
jgi:hypothetical protein